MLGMGNQIKLQHLPHGGCDINNMTKLLLFSVDLPTTNTLCLFILQEGG